MPTRYSYMSSTEFERELQTRFDHTGQLVLGSEMAQEVLERVRQWVDRDFRLTSGERSL